VVDSAISQPKRTQPEQTNKRNKNKRFLASARENFSDGVAPNSRVKYLQELRQLWEDAP